MAKMSQKELLEEGFSDKIRGIAKAGVAGLKQAAAQGVNLDTGQLAKGMYKSYKGEQPVAFLKQALANDKDIGIVKIDKSNIKKQQASGKKGYLGRIVGPKTVTLIPFEGTLYNKKERRYEGPGAGTSPPPDAVNAELKNEATAYMGDSRGEGGKYKPVSEKGSVKGQLVGALTKIGIDDQSAKEFTEYLSRNMKPFLAGVQKTRAGRGYDFTFDPDAALGVAKTTKKAPKFPRAGGVAEGPTVQELQDNPPETKKLVVPEGLSLRDILQLSSFLILEKETDAELARLLGFKSRQEMRDAFREAGGKRKWLEQNPEAVKAAAALRRRKERGQDIGDKEEPKPETEPKPEPEKEDFSEYMKMGPAKFIANLSDEQMESLLKDIQEIQPGLDVQFKLKASQDYLDRKEKEETGPKSDYQGETGMFVAEIFRTKDGLQLGDIYRQEDPTDIVRGAQQSKSKEEVKLSPFDKAVETLKTKNNLKANALASAIKDIKDVNIITKITGKEEGVRLSDEDIVKIKNELIKQNIIKEKSSQKILLRQLTLLSR